MSIHPCPCSSDEPENDDIGGSGGSGGSDDSVRADTKLLLLPPSANVNIRRTLRMLVYPQGTTIRRIAFGSNTNSNVSKEIEETKLSDLYHLNRHLKVFFK